MQRKVILVKTSLAVLLCLLVTAGMYGVSRFINSNSGIPSEEELFEFYKRADHPLLFYGKVIDQDDVPVQGVKITIQTIQAHGSFRDAMAANDWRKYIEQTLVTNSDGIFSLSTEGHYLSILKLEKEGYTETRGYTNYFTYGHPVHGQDRAGIHKPDSKNPVIYRLWKNENNLVIPHYFQHSFNTADGSQILDITSGRWNRTTTGVIFDVEVIPREEGTRKHSWNFKIRIQNGGIVETVPSHFFRAPEEGYQSELVYSYDEKSDNWTQRHNQAFYYIYLEEAKSYAGLGISIISFHNGNINITGSVVFNPTGSRNLQPEQ